jgi:hypothetical protein
MVCVSPLRRIAVVRRWTGLDLLGVYTSHTLDPRSFRALERAHIGIGHSFPQACRVAFILSRRVCSSLLHVPIHPFSTCLFIPD